MTTSRSSDGRECERCGYVFKEHQFRRHKKNCVGTQCVHCGVMFSLFADFMGHQCSVKGSSPSDFRSFLDDMFGGVGFAIPVIPVVPGEVDDLRARLALIDRVHKLVRLAGSDNENEARSAAYLACKLIRENDLDIGYGPKE